jgi:WD40 repeat protein/Ca2+-binding EF-hand superfamily protein
MMKLPASQLTLLRDDFNSKPGGLSMYQFVSVMLKYSNSQKTLARAATLRQTSAGNLMGGKRKNQQQHDPSKEHVASSREANITTVKDLVELFHQIDVNGDDSMEWDEFTGFIINMAMASGGDHFFHDHWAVREFTGKIAALDGLHPPDPSHMSQAEDKSQAVLTTLDPLRSRVQQVKFEPELNLFLVSCGVSVYFFDPRTGQAAGQSSLNVEKTSLPAATVGGMTLTARAYPADCETNIAYKRRLQRGEDALSCLSSIFLPELDVLSTLTSDLNLTFHKVTNRGSVSSESLRPSSRVSTESQQYVQAWDGSNNRLFTAGCDNDVLVWEIFEKESTNREQEGKYKVTATLITRLSYHKDTVKDLLVVIDPEYELSCLLSAGLDTSINMFDLATLRPMRTLVGHTSGVRSLTYDWYGGLCSAGFEYDIFVWDLDAGLTYPLNKLVKGHTSPIAQVASPYKSGRLASLDTKGKFCWWDIRRNVALENHERNIQSFTPALKCTTFGLSNYSEAALEYSTNGISLVAGSKKLSTFDSIDVRPPEAPPTHATFNPVSYNFITVHEKDLKVWDPDTGRLIREVTNFSPTEITNFTFDSKMRKAIISNQSGEITIFNNSNWSPIASLPKQDSEISCLLYAKEDKCIISGSWDRSIRVFDDFHNDPKSSLLRIVTDAHDSDLTSIDYDHSLGLIASGSVDGSVKIWDFQFLLLESDCTKELETTSEVTCIKFVNPYPLVLSADSDGGVTLIPVRPYLGTSRYKSILRFENCGSGGYSVKPNAEGVIDPTEEANCIAAAEAAEKPCAASVMEVYYDFGDGGEINNTGVQKGRHLAVTGDEQGWIRIYDISAALKAAELVVPKESQMPKCQPSYNPYRRCTRDGLTYREAERGAKVAGGEEGSQVSKEELDAEADKAVRVAKRQARATRPQFETTALNEFKHIQLIAAWPAHTGSLTSIELISDPPSILTAGVDNAVHLWDMKGNERGCLTRGRELDSMWKKAWSFDIDKLSFENAKLANAEAVYDCVLEMERKEALQDKKHAEMVAEMTAIRAKTPTSRQSNRSPTHHHPKVHHSRSPTNRVGFPSPGGGGLGKTSPDGGQSPFFGGDNDEEEKKTDAMLEEDEESYSDESYYSDSSEDNGHGPNKLSGAQWEEEKGRLFGQLKGIETWQKTEKEIMRKDVMQRRITSTKKMFHKLQRAEKEKEEDPYQMKKKKKKRRKKKKNQEGIAEQEATLAKSRTSKDLPPSTKDPTDDDIMNSLDDLGKRNNDGTQALFTTFNVNTIVIDTDKDDPDNWGIASTNRQSSMYGHFYDEKKKLDVAARRSIVAKQALVDSLIRPSAFLASKEQELSKIKVARSPGQPLAKSKSKPRLTVPENNTFDGDDIMGYGFDNIQDDYDAQQMEERQMMESASEPLFPPVSSASKSPLHATGRTTRDRSKAHSHGKSYQVQQTRVTLKDLEDLTEQSAKNQARWMSRVEGFAEKVFGLDEREASRRNTSKIAKQNKRTAITNSQTRVKQESLAKHRGHGAAKEVRRTSNIGEYQSKLRGTKFFGPYSAKEVLLMADVFSCIARGMNMEDAQNREFNSVQDTEAETKAAMMALQGKASLHLFFNEPEITARKHFLAGIHQLSTTSTGHKDKGRVSLEAVFGSVFPFMKRSELSDALEYVSLPDEKKPVLNPKFTDPGASTLSVEKVEQLRELFDLYDADGNGCVDASEIKAALKANQKANTERNRMGSVVMADKSEEDAIMKMIQGVSGVGAGSNELNFDQFVDLFHDLL